MQIGRPLLEAPPDLATPKLAFAGPADFAECRRLHRLHGTTYYFATRFFHRRHRDAVHAVYGFVRVADEWVDNPGDLTPEERRELLMRYRMELTLGIDGVRPEHPVLRAFCDVMRTSEMSIEEPLLFLDAMAQDIYVDRYPTYADLRHYMRGSASAVGLMMCTVLRCGENPRMIAAAQALGEAMQLTNFLRDVGEDGERGRIYLPQEDMQAFGVLEEDVLARRMTPEFVQLLKFEIARARALYAEADFGIPLLPDRVQPPIRLARVLYSRILDRIEAQDYNVFAARARTTKWEKFRVLAQVLLTRAPEGPVAK